MFNIQNKYRNKVQLFITFLGLTGVLLITHSAQAQTLFFDDFSASGNDVNRTVWATPTGDAAFFGNTSIRPGGSGSVLGIPNGTVVEGGMARLRLDTYDPTFFNGRFRGSEIDTIQTFQPTAGSGISFEASVRSDVNLPSGAITSMFGFGLDTTSAILQRDELDFEFLTKQYKNPSNPTVFLNRYDDEGFSSLGQSASVFTDINFAEFNTFKMNWFTDKVEWLINDELIYTALDEIPNEPMSLRFNTWVPDQFFPEAYDPTFLEAQKFDDNQTYFYDIDYAKVSAIPNSVVPEPATLILFGSGIMGAFIRKRKLA